MPSGGTASIDVQCEAHIGETAHGRTAVGLDVIVAQQVAGTSLDGQAWPIKLVVRLNVEKIVARHKSGELRRALKHEALDPAIVQPKSPFVLLASVKPSGCEANVVLVLWRVESWDYGVGFVRLHQFVPAVVAVEGEMIVDEVVESEGGTLGLDLV